jgi:hypothetical protein
MQKAVHRFPEDDPISLYKSNHLPSRTAHCSIQTLVNWESELRGVNPKITWCIKDGLRHISVQRSLWRDIGMPFYSRAMFRDVVMRGGKRRDSETSRPFSLGEQSRAIRYSVSTKHIFVISQFSSIDRQFDSQNFIPLR